MAIGTGWLGWTEQQTDDTLIPVILLAYEERCRMFRALFGGGSGKADKPAPEIAPAASVFGIFRAAASGDPARQRRG